MNRKKLTVLITTSGTGSRLGELTKKNNKCLVAVSEKPAISHIISQYPENTEFVITIGYLGSLVKNTITRLYPQKNITFIKVDKYRGVGSSLAYSILKCKRVLQKPFIFNACDTIFKGSISYPNQNWIGGYQQENDGQYRTLMVKNNKVAKILEKDENGSQYIHIGLVGIHDYADFWSNLNKIYQSNKQDQTLNDTNVIQEMIDKGFIFEYLPIDGWYDTGNPISLEKSNRDLSKNEI